MRQPPRAGGSSYIGDGDGDGDNDDDHDHDHDHDHDGDHDRDGYVRPNRSVTFFMATSVASSRTRRAGGLEFRCG